MARFKAGLGQPFDPTYRFQTSWLVSPKVLLGIRALLSLYIFTTLLFNIGYSCARPSLGGCTNARASFSYFTVLSYWGLGFYFLVSSYHAFTYIRRGAPALSSWPFYLQWLHSAFYSTVTVFPFLVLIVFWALLSSPTTLSTTYSIWSNTSQHILNAFFAAAEIVLPRTSPVPWDHLPFQILLLALYLALAYLTHATKGFYTYSFLDAEKQGGLVAAYVFGIAVGVCILFAVVQGLIWVRRWVTEEKLGLDGVFAKTHVRENGDLETGGGAGAGAGLGADGHSDKEGETELRPVRTAAA